MNDRNKPLTYKDAGVDIDAGNRLVEQIKSISKRTHRPGVLGGLGGFGACFELPTGYREPVLVSGTDGVGTKLRLAIDTGRHDHVGIDLVAMCVNDLIVQGAEPLYFLDYFATGKLDVDVATRVVAGIGAGCELSGCALTGGETAEMPGMYPDGDYDLAGFCVGIVEKSEIIDGQSVQAGDKIIALASSGPHSNGYSLIRKIIDDGEHDLQLNLADKPLIDHLMAPTRIYVKSLLAAKEQFQLKALSHITGGGFSENIPRTLPSTCQARIHRDSWELPPVFQWLQEQAQLSEKELFRTFNCGVGMVVVVSEAEAEACIDFLNEQGETAWLLGEVAARSEDNDAQVLFIE